MPFGLARFKESDFGHMVGEVLTHRDHVLAMRILSENEIPAVQAVGRHLVALGRPFTDEEKKLVGRWVREIMEAQGFAPVRKGRVRQGNLFSTGAIYAPRDN